MLQWHSAWETEGRIVQAPVYTAVTSRKQLFSVGYFQQFRCLFRLKEDGKISHAALDVKVQLILTQTIFIWFLSQVLWENNGSTILLPSRRAQTQFRLLSAVPMQRKWRGGKGGQRYHRGESVVMAVLLWPCWLADSLTWDHFGQLTSISLCSEDETDPMELLIPPTLPTKHKQNTHLTALRESLLFLPAPLTGIRGIRRNKINKSASSLLAVSSHSLRLLIFDKAHNTAFVVKGKKLFCS